MINYEEKLEALVNNFYSDCDHFLSKNDVNEDIYIYIDLIGQGRTLNFLYDNEDSQIEWYINELLDKVYDFHTGNLIEGVDF